MGADIYLNSKFKPNQAKHKAEFEKAVAIRDAFPRGSKEADEAQKAVSASYSAMYAVGYFRDSYNSSTFLNKIGLSWWRDIVPLLDEGTDDKMPTLPISEAVKLRKIVAETPLIEAEIAKVFPDDPREKVREYFEEARRDLVALLDESIALNEPLEMSL